MLSSVVSAAKLTVYPTVALVIFFGVFALIAWQVFKKSNQPRWKECAHIPFDNEPNIASEVKP